MCTAGFWKDKNKNIHYFKNRMLVHNPVSQQVDFSELGIFISDENGRFEGMNNDGVFAVGLTMKPSVKRLVPRSIDINRDILLKCHDAKSAVEYFYHVNEKYDMGFIELVGDWKNVFYIEVSPDQITCADLTHLNYFACTNHGLLMVHQGSWRDPKNSSHCRLAAAQEFLRTVTDYDGLKDLMCLHNDGLSKNSVCAHDDKNSHTVAAYIFSPSTRSGEICINGHPCEKGFTKYNLDAVRGYEIHK